MDLHMKKTSRILALLLSLVAVFSLFGCGSKDSGDSNDGSDSSDDGTVYTISWAHSSSTNDRLALATEKMAAELEEASNGRLKIEHYPASQLGAEREILEGVALGTIDCGIISSGVVAGFSNSVYVTNMPYLIDDREIGWKVYDGEFGQMLGQKTEEEGGWKFLGWCDNSLRMFSNTKHEIQTPADMVGLKIRTQENDIHMAIVNSLGASATPVAFSELYTALQQGTVDGQENPLSIITANGFYDVQKYLSLSGHFYSTALFIVNPDFWASLPAEYQEIIQAASEECRDYDRQLSSESEADMIQTCKDNGMEVNEIDAEAFKSAMDSVWALYTDKYGTDAVNLALTSSGQEPLA